MSTAMKLLYEKLYAGPVVGLNYDFRNHTGLLFLESGHCADMRASIALFSEIDDEVQLIISIEGGDRDAVYIKTESGWDVRVLRHGVPRPTFIKGWRRDSKVVGLLARLNCDDQDERVAALVALSALGLSEAEARSLVKAPRRAR